MTWTDIALKVADALLPIIVMLLMLALGALFNWLRVQAAKVKSDLARESLTAALNQAEKVGFDAISAVNQVLVDELKAKSADGTLTKQEAAEAMRAAIEYFKTHISPQALTILQAAYGPIEEWLESFLEAKVAQVKWGKEAASITVPPSSPASEPAPGSTD